MTYYFLFGETASDQYSQREKPGDVDITNCQIYKYEEHKDNPVALLDAFNGWMDYCEIPEKHYDSLARRINKIISWLITSDSSTEEKILTNS